MSTYQEYWDACLIRAWRQNQNLFTASENFYSIVGIKIEDLQLYRVPAKYIPFAVGVKVFVARHLPKINDWLWSHAPDRDIDLLHKLAASKYDASKKPFMTNADKALQKEQATRLKNNGKITFIKNDIKERNHDTDWGVTKGAARRKIVRR